MFSFNLHGTLPTLQISRSTAFQQGKHRFSTGLPTGKTRLTAPECDAVAGRLPVGRKGNPRNIAAVKHQGVTRSQSRGNRRRTMSFQRPSSVLPASFQRPSRVLPAGERCSASAGPLGR